MRYVTTNIRLPEPLWKSLKLEAARDGKRLGEVIRERLAGIGVRLLARSRTKPRSVRGLWKKTNIPDTLIAEAQRTTIRGTKSPRS